MLIPHNGRVLVKPALLNVEKKTPGGIIIPDQVKEDKAFFEGTIAKLAPGLEAEMKKADLECFLKEGDTILYSKYAGVELKKDNETWLLLKYDDILGTLEQ